MSAVYLSSVVRINHWCYTVVTIQLFNFVHKFCSLYGIPGCPHFRLKCAAYNGNVIHTWVKHPLKWGVRISEVRNSGVPLYTFFHLLPLDLLIAETIGLVHDCCYIHVSVFTTVFPDWGYNEVTFCGDRKSSFITIITSYMVPIFVFLTEIFISMPLSFSHSW